MFSRRDGAMWEEELTELGYISKGNEIGTSFFIFNFTHGGSSGGGGA